MYLVRVFVCWRSEQRAEEKHLIMRYNSDIGRSNVELLSRFLFTEVFRASSAADVSSVRAVPIHVAGFWWSIPSPLRPLARF